MSDKETSRRNQFSREGAMGLKARVLLYAASPLFNGGVNQYKSLKNKNGVELFPEEDKEKWRIAAEYAEEVILELEGRGYGLIRGTTTESTELLNTMRDIELSIWAPQFQSKEAIMMFFYNDKLWWRKMPKLGTKTTDPHFAPEADGILGTNIRMVNKFYTVNGLPMSEDKTWVYGEGYAMAQERDLAYMDVIPLRTDVLSLHLQREPRFYATIAAPGLFWRRGTDFNMLVDSYQGGLFGLQQDRIDPKMAQNVTGYYVKKGIRSDFSTKDYSPSINSLLGNSNVAMRMAELYLIAAEAWNEYEGPNGPHRDQIFTRLNDIRDRAGIPTVQESWGKYGTNPNKFNEQSGLRDIIRQERTIELMFEGHRFWDVRRWGTAIAEGWNDKPMGWVVTADNWEDFFNRGKGPVVVWNKAQFLPSRDYLFPIKSEEAMISGIVQNPGW